MQIKKKRITVTLKKDVALYIKRMANQEGISQSHKASQMIALALKIGK